MLRFRKKKEAVTFMMSMLAEQARMHDLCHPNGNHPPTREEILNAAREFGLNIQPDYVPPVLTDQARAKCGTYVFN